MAVLDENGLAELWSIINKWGLAEETKTMLGLPKGSTPNTAFQKLAMPYGYYGFDVTTIFEDGSIAPNIILSGLQDFSGNTVMTDENGRCPIAVHQSATPTVTISGYLDVVDTSVTLSTQDGFVFTPVTIRLAKNTSTHTITASSSTLRTTGVSTYDITAVGGGGGGAKNDGGGGGGGYMTTKLGVSIDTVNFSVTVGGGGATGNSGGSSSVIDGNSVVLVAANGGGGGGSSTGGAGNGKGGDIRQAGANAVGYLFDDESLGVPGGGGGGGTLTSHSSIPGSWEQKPGGSPYGGGGSHSYRDADYNYHYYGGEAGKGPGGGGGAGRSGYNGGAGAAGVVFMRARFV